MKSVLIVVVFIFVLLRKASAQTPGPGECTRARDRYTDLNDHLPSDRQDDADTTPQAEKNWTLELTGFVTQNILARLTDIGDAGAIRAYLTCMQEEDRYRPWDDLTNTPQVFFTALRSVPLALTAMLIMRGGTGIPDTLPLVQCFSNVNGKWALVANGNEHGFDMHALYIDELRSPVPNESWYLLFNKVNGQGGSVRMEIVACGTKQMRTVWQRDDIKWAKIKVYAQTIVSLTYEKQEHPEIAKLNGDKLGTEMYIEDDSENRKRFSGTLHVTPNGLEP